MSKDKQPFELLREDGEESVWACPICRQRHEQETQPISCEECGYDRRPVAEQIQEGSANFVGAFFEAIGGAAAEVDNVVVHVPGMEFVKEHIKEGYRNRKVSIVERKKRWEDRRAAMEAFDGGARGVGKIVRFFKKEAEAGRA